jgi:hypothetical protein
MITGNLGLDVLQWPVIAPLTNTLLRAAGDRKAAADILLELPTLKGIDRHEQRR